MKWLLIIALGLMNTTMSEVIHNFNKQDDLKNWLVVNDGVMGGLSQGTMSINSEGHVVFEGIVSLENNGGFSSVRKRMETLDVNSYQKLVIRLKGDGKRYQLRVKSDKSDRHSYIQYIQTSGEWQELEVNLSDMYPSFRGRRLAIPNYPKVTLEEFAILIANKKAESFRLEIDYILLR